MKQLPLSILNQVNTSTSKEALAHTLKHEQLEMMEHVIVSSQFHAKNLA